MFSYVSPEQRIPKDHPLRAIRALVDGVLADMSREFDQLYAATEKIEWLVVFASAAFNLIRLPKLLPRSA